MKMKLLLENWKKYLNEDLSDMMSLTFKDFDQPESGKGWRTIKDPASQAAVMQKYIDLNAGEITDGNLSLLMWHMAQALAYAGENQKSANIMKKVVERQKGQSAEEIIDYGKATIAFLERNSQELNNIYDKYRDRIDKQNSQDMNMNIIGCMKRCSDKNNFNYSSAYQSDPNGCKC
jgi:hypothetical protein